MKKPLIALLNLAAATTLLLAACGPAAPTSESTPANTPGSNSTPQAKGVESKLDRITSPQTTQTDLEKLVAGNTAFAFDLYQAVSSGDGNLVYSPYSLSLALAMAYAGAKGPTADQMSSVLHYSLPAAQFHPAFNSLDLDLAKRPSQAADVEADKRFQLSIANSLWGEQKWSFLQSYLDLLAANYGAGLKLVDFANAPEDARKQINDWVAKQTQDKIKDILPPGVIDSSTRLALANAIYFKAFWETSFMGDATSEQPFHLLDGSEGKAQMMFLEPGTKLNYATGSGWSAVSLPYKGGLTEMVVIVPDQGNFDAIQKGMSSGFYSQVVASMQPTRMLLSMPKFKFETPYSMKDVLSGMGMNDAFDPGKADFSGIDGQKDLYIGAVLHKAFIAVDETGTEAAAATVVVMPAMAGPVSTRLTIDRPFFFFIRDVPTDTILFMGRVLDPSK